MASAAPLLDGPEDAPTTPRSSWPTRGTSSSRWAGGAVDACAREIYAEWAACQHFELYDEVPDVLRELAAAGLRIGLISNSHRCLASFQSHFELQGLISATVSSSEHGFMKPHPSIFSAALQLVDVPPAEAVMVGDSVRQDVEGALRAGMRAGAGASRRAAVPSSRPLREGSACHCHPGRHRELPPRVVKSGALVLRFKRTKVLGGRATNGFGTSDRGQVLITPFFLPGQPPAD